VSTDNESGQPGSAAANQHKTEPMPPTQGHDQPDAASTRPEAPDLGSMNVGANDPQAPHRDGAAGATSVPSASDVPAEQTPVLTGESPGTGYRQPGSMGSTGPDEQIETDIVRSAQNASPVGTPGTDSGPGDAGAVPVVSAYPAEGTSEESAIAQGTRTPQ
jgi:hypothetical protein